MIAGHFGFAAIVKSRERSAPLWALMLATVWLDIVFVPLLLTHVESIEPVRNPPGYGGLIIHADFTHSLLGMLVLSAALGLAFLSRWGKRTALVVALVSASHWLLDLPMHRADMPILPENFGNLPRLGFGLWAHPQLAAALELIFVLAGSLLYWRAALAVSHQAAQTSKWANISSGLIAVFGFLILYLDYTA